MCERVKQKLIEHWKSQGIDFVQEDPAENGEEEDQEATSSQQSTKSTSSTQSTTRRKRAYVPAHRSGAYAILVALYEAEQKFQQASVCKSQLLELAQPYCNESMTKPKAGSHYTAFNSMKTLINNGMVVSEQHRNMYYSLTEPGRDLGKRLYEHILQNGQSGCDDPSSEDEVENPIPSKKQDYHEFKPGCFDVVLLVDTREKVSGKTNIVSELADKGVKAELRALPAGDFVWIAKEKIGQSSTQKSAPVRELVFDFVIERKKADDLSSSILDGRFHEQKQRLVSCGLLKPIYLVEGLNKAANYAVPYRRLIHAVTDSQVIDGFNVKCTKDFDETVEYLSSLTELLQHTYLNETLHPRHIEEVPIDSHHFISYNSFEHGAKKITNFTVQEMFLKHLVQFGQMSIPKAKSIINEYATLNHLISAFEKCSLEKEKERFVAKIKYGYNERSIGPVLSGKIYKFYSYKDQ